MCSILLTEGKGDVFREKGSISTSFSLFVWVVTTLLHYSSPKYCQNSFFFISGFHFRLMSPNIFRTSSNTFVSRWKRKEEKNIFYFTYFLSLSLLDPSLRHISTIINDINKNGMLLCSTLLYQMIWQNISTRWFYQNT